MLLAAPAAHATSFRTVYVFSGGNDGGYPESPLITDANGNLYGLANAGGVRGGGVVYRLRPASGTAHGYSQTTLYAFCILSNCTDGQRPIGALVLRSGALYGATVSGGVFGGGAVFKLTPPTEQGQPWTETVLHGFATESSAADGYNPNGGLVFDQAGNLFGTTNAGGTAGAKSSGAIFELTHSGVYTILYSFPTDSRLGVGLNWGLTLDEAGNLYGITQQGGSPECADFGAGCGSVFELSPPGPGKTAWIFTTLYDFHKNKSGHNGFWPYGGVIRRGGALYGTTENGGIRGNFGTVYKLSPPKSGAGFWNETIIEDFFRHGDGWSDEPLAGVVFDSAGNLFGTTNGPGKDSSDNGTLYRLSRPASGKAGWSEAPLALFTSLLPTGIYPRSLMINAAGSVYGVTYAGGDTNANGGYGFGTVFQLLP